MHVKFFLSLSFILGIRSKENYSSQLGLSNTVNFLYFHFLMNIGRQLNMRRRHMLVTSNTDRQWTKIWWSWLVKLKSYVLSCLMQRKEQGRQWQTRVSWLSWSFILKHSLYSRSTACKFGWTLFYFFWVVYMQVLDILQTITILKWVMEELHTLTLMACTRYVSNCDLNISQATPMLKWSF